MSGSVRLATSNPTSEDAPREARPRRKRQAILVTQDDALWPLVGAAIPSDVVLSQADTIDQLVGASETGASGVVVWDARTETDPAASLEAVHRHSARLVVMVLDDPSRAAHWQRLVKKGHLVSVAPLPFDPAAFQPALDTALEEAQVRVALLGQNAPVTGAAAPADVGGTRADGAERAPPRRPAWMAPVGALLLAAVAGGAWWWSSRPAAPTPGAAAPGPAAASSAPAPGAPASPSVATPSAVPQGDPAAAAARDLALSKARQAMTDRRYIEPADNSALGYFREALARDPANAEARQGLARLEQLLIARAETALDQRHFDVALQSLEAARSIDKNDPRITALDARVLQLKAELGAASIQAAINAGNYARAGSQIDEAAHAKSLPAEQLAGLRASLNAHQAADAERAAKAQAQAKAQAERAAQEARQQQAARDAEAQAERQRLAGLFRERLAEGKLTEPARDSAAFYLDALKGADPQNAQLAAWSQELKQKLDASHATPGPAAAAAATAPLVLVKPIRPAYPTEALRAGTEGWVDLAFQVGPDGRPSAIQVVDAQPSGVFERAAVNAVQAARYQPLPRNAPQVARPAKQRVTFKLSN